MLVLLARLLGPLGQGCAAALLLPAASNKRLRGVVCSSCNAAAGTLLHHIMAYLRVHSRAVSS